MKKCVNCKRFKPISYVGGVNIYPYCNQGNTYKPHSGGANGEVVQLVRAIED